MGSTPRRIKIDLSERSRVPILHEHLLRRSPAHLGRARARVRRLVLPPHRARRPREGPHGELRGDRSRGGDDGRAVPLCVRRDAVRRGRGRGGVGAAARRGGGLVDDGGGRIGLRSRTRPARRVRSARRRGLGRLRRVHLNAQEGVGAWWRPDEFGTWSGLTQVAGNLGGLLAAAPLALLVAIAGWRATFGGVAVLSIVLAGLCLALVRDRPEDAGFPPPLPRGVVPRVSVAEGYRTVFGNRKTWPMFFVFFFQYGTYLSFSGLWAVPWMRDVYGMTAKQSDRKSVV